MGKNFSILKVDLNKLSSRIDDYRHETGELYPYIFMNEETIRVMSNDYLSKLDPLCEHLLRMKYPNGLVGKYEGYKIFRDNDLNFGEVELR